MISECGGDSGGAGSTEYAGANSNNKETNK